LVYDWTVAIPTTTTSRPLAKPGDGIQPSSSRLIWMLSTDATVTHPAWMEKGSTAKALVRIDWPAVMPGMEVT
jgi:hypothetical protein